MLSLKSILLEVVANRPFRLIRIATCVLLLSPYVPAGDWPMFGHDPQRSGWAPEENTLSPDNVSALKLQWKTKVNNQFYSLSALTAPVVMARVPTAKMVRSVVYVAGISGTVFALDAQTGEVIWTRTLRSMATPRKAGLQGTFLCPNGITATPVADEKSGLLYAIAADGALYGLDLATGTIQYGPMPFVAPYAKSWSLNLYEGSVYTTVSNGCGGGRAGVYSIDIQHPHQPVGRGLFLSNGFTAGIWGRGGAVIGKNGKIYGGTADGNTDPARGDYSNTVVAISSKDLSVTDHFLPTNWQALKRMDFDIGSASPVWFPWHNRNLVAHGAKEGIVYLMDADDLAGKDHQTPLFITQRLGNDSQECCDGEGIWGGLSSSRDAEGRTWVYVPMGGPPASPGMKFPLTNGENTHGSIMAFTVESDPRTSKPILAPAWISGDFNLPDPVVVANGVVFALSNGENADQRGAENKRSFNTRPAVLKALDAKTGRELFNSGSAMTTWVHFSGLALADGRVFAVDHDSTVYCFGIGGAPTTSSQTAPQDLLAAKRVEGGDSDISTSWVERAQNQDELLRNWLKRAAITALLGVVAAMVGLWAGLRRQPRL